MKFVSRVALAALGATALTAIAAPASAQRIDNIVSFGDSYADTGNAVYIILNNPLTPPGTIAQIQTVYPTGRFSGGTNYIDTLSDILNATVENYAIGGAQTGTGNQNTGLPGLTQEVGIFLSGTVPPGTIFPVSDGVFGPNDLLAVSIGGNDARAYQQANPASTIGAAQTAALTSIANATANLNALVAAGAQNISFLAGDTGTLPEVALDPTAQAIRSAYSATYNTAMQGVLGGYAAQGVMVHYLDLNAVQANILADPAAYGITNGLVCPIFPDPTCVLNAEGYLFYGDALHLTSDGFAVVGQYIATQLTAPLTLQAPADVGMDVARQFGRTLTARMDLGAPRDGDMPEGLKFFIVGDGFQRDVDASAFNDAFDTSSVGITVGGEIGFGSGVVGLAGNYSRGRANFGNDAAKVTTDSFQIGAYAAAGLGGGFIQGYLGYGWDSHDVSRRGVVMNMDSSPDGDHWLAGAKAGYLFPMGGLRIGPVIALDYAKVDVDGYVESGDAALNLIVDDQSFSSLRGSIGLELRGDVDNNGVQFRPYAALVAEKELDGDDRSISFAQTTSPGIINSWSFEDASTKLYGRGTVGMSARIFANTSIDAAISTTFGKEQGNETSGHVGVKIGL